jgi:hypothetical protein
MEFQNYFVTRMRVSLLGLSMEVRKVQRTQNYQNSVWIYSFGAFTGLRFQDNPSE